MDGRPLSAPWSGLPRELLENIAKRLDSRVDVLHFRAVCSTWRSSFALPKFKSIPDCTLKLPFPILHSPDIHLNRRGFFSLFESTLFFVQPLKRTSEITGSWLIKIQESDEMGQKMRLMNPLSRYPWASFRFESFDVPGGLNLLDHKVTEVSKAYVLEFVDIGKNPPVEPYELKYVRCKKVAVSSKTDAFAFMAIHTLGKLGIWKMSEKKWITVNDGRQISHYEDVCYHEGKFYAVDYTGLTISVNSSMEVTEVASPLHSYEDDDLHFYKYLVKSGRDLLLVGKFEPDVEDIVSWKVDCDSGRDGDELHYDFYVYKLNEEGKSWVPVNSLDDRVLFVGDDCSFSITAQDFPGCKRNCIYYPERSFAENGFFDELPGYDVGLFDMRSGYAKLIQSVPGASELFWPPPDWLNPGSNSSSPTV